MVELRLYSDNRRYSTWEVYQHIRCVINMFSLCFSLVRGIIAPPTPLVFDSESMQTECGCVAHASAVQWHCTVAANAFSFCLLTRFPLSSSVKKEEEDLEDKKSIKKRIKELKVLDPKIAQNLCKYFPSCLASLLRISFRGVPHCIVSARLSHQVSGGLV